MLYLLIILYLKRATQNCRNFITNTRVFYNNNQMLPVFWSKKVLCQITMDPEDVADEVQPLPLYIQLYWNHYIGFYYDQIKQFFSSWLPYPLIQDHFYLQEQTQNIELDPTQIVGNLVNCNNIGIQQPLRLICHFRSQKQRISIDLKKYYKSSLKAATCIRNGKYGSSILTLNMSIKNVDQMYEAFRTNDIQKYLGEKNFQSQNLGYEYLISRSQKIPIILTGKDIFVQRSVDKGETLQQFLKELIDEKQLNSQENIFDKFVIKLHGVQLRKGGLNLRFFQRYCHPNGFLYLTIQ